jgi:hypothetical protein
MSPSSAYFTACGDFAIHAGTTITFAGGVSTIPYGDIGVFPGTSIVGNFELVEGKIATTEAARDCAAFAVFDHAAKLAEGGWKTMAVEIGGETFLPGAYRSATAINLAYGTKATLDGNNDPNSKFLFQAGAALFTAADTSFILERGAKAENVIWVLGTAATLGANSVVEGTILTGTAITFGNGSELHGRAIAQSAVTFAGAGSVCIGDACNVGADLLARRLRGQKNK